MTASKCRTTHRKTLFRFHKDDPVLHDHKPNETSKGSVQDEHPLSGGDSCRGSGQPTCPCGPPRSATHASTIRPLRRADCTFRTAGDAGVPSEKHSSTRLNEAMGALWLCRRAPRTAQRYHSRGSASRFAGPGSACKKALACSRRDRCRSAAGIMEDTGDVARTGSAGSPSDGAAPISPSTAVWALAAARDAGIDLPSGMLGQDDRAGDSLHGAFVVPSQLAWTSAGFWRVSSTTRVLSGLQTQSPWWRRSDSTCRAFEAVTTCSRIPASWS